MNIHMTSNYVLAGGAAATMAIAGTIFLFAPRAADATPAYAKQTGKACTECHQSPQGGALTPFGQQFKDNGNKLPKN
jgi:hypothetical protein